MLNLIKLIFFMVYPYLKLHILFNSNGLASWSGFPDITHIKKIMASSELLVKWMYGINFGAIHKKMLTESR